MEDLLCCEKILTNVHFSYGVTEVTVNCCRCILYAVGLRVILLLVVNLINVGIRCINYETDVMSLE